jgi:shikimate dehydrogenase
VPIHILLVKFGFVNIFYPFFERKLFMDFKTFALVGHPVGHSMSPLLHSRLFALSGVKAHYVALDIAPQKLAGYIPHLRRFDGFNITIPHKQAIIPMLDSCSGKAAESGSVNTVKNSGGRLCGYTTDGMGFRLAIEAAGADLGGKTVILGAGGAARAIAFELAHAGACITVATRPHSANAAKGLCAGIRKSIPEANVSSCLIPELSGKWDLLVNATPAGMYPGTESCAAGEELVKNSGCVFDAVYNPGETVLLSLARKNGKKTVGGIGMLVGQAAASEEIWLGTHFSQKALAHICGEVSLEMKKKFGSVVLCGFMGSGKTTCGRLLAETAGRKFIDMDDYIEKKEHRPVAQIFKDDGEETFRRMERDAVEELSRTGGLVIASGGGTLLKKENADAFRANNIVVLLDASLSTVRERLKGDNSRPLLSGPDSDEKMKCLYAEREPSYHANSDFTINADGTPESTVDAILALLKPAM